MTEDTAWTDEEVIELGAHPDTIMLANENKIRRLAVEFAVMRAILAEQGLSREDLDEAISTAISRTYGGSR